MEERIAQTLQLKINDHISLSLAGEIVEARVGSVRSVRWDNLAPNFYLITNQAPQSELTANWITSLYVPPEQRATLTAYLKQYPNISAIDVAQTLGTFRQLMHKLSQAVELVWCLRCSRGVGFISQRAGEFTLAQAGNCPLRVAGASKRYAIAGLVGSFYTRLARIPSGINCQ